jgi:Undecaprenyl-phosphate glucose phosphotransferase
MIKENQKYLNKILVALDAISIIMSLMIAWYIRFKSGFIVIDSGYLTFKQYLKPVMIAVPIYLGIYNLCNLYIPYRLRSSFDEFLGILKANVSGLFIFILGLYIIKEINYSRYLLLIFCVLSTFLTFVERFAIRIILRKIRAKGYNLKHILLIGLSNQTYEFLSRLSSNKQWGYKVAGVLDDNYNDKMITYSSCYQRNNDYEDIYDEVAAVSEDTQVCNIMGKISDLESILLRHTIDEIFITLNLNEYDKMGSIINICEKQGIRAQVIPGYYKYIPAKPYIEEVDGLPIINLRYIPLDNLINKFLKRVFDIMASTLCIMIFSPVMLLTAIIIKITSPGPVIFKQERVGLERKTFTMYKFRSMKLQKDEDEVYQWTTAYDPRKTAFGNFIRRTSIDELPQLFNVLKGDMSLIGPRPERPHFVEKFKEEIPKYMVKHQVRPGITGWAQVHGWRGDTSISKRIEHDIYYIENWSFLMDIKILWMTLFKGFVNKNAY